MNKASNLLLTKEYLTKRADGLQKAGYPVSKWIEFSLGLLERGYSVTLYEAQTTYSKYLTVSKSDSKVKPVKIRFSNHKPILERELAGNCDFFVGVTNLRTTNSRMAHEFVASHFAPLF